MVVHEWLKVRKKSVTLAGSYITWIRSPFSYIVDEPSIEELLVRHEMRCVGVRV